MVKLCDVAKQFDWPCPPSKGTYKDFAHVGAKNQKKVFDDLARRSKHNLQQKQHSANDDYEDEERQHLQGMGVLDREYQRAETATGCDGAGCEVDDASIQI